MGYQECYKETNELAAERYELVAERIAEIAEAAQAPEPFAEYFRTNAAYLQSLRALYEKGKSGSLAARSMEECEADNEALYGEILPEAYGHSYANPAYAAARLGETFGGALLASCGTSSDGMRGGFPWKSGAAYDRDGAVCGGLQLL